MGDWGAVSRPVLFPGAAWTTWSPNSRIGRVLRRWIFAHQHTVHVAVGAGGRCVCLYAEDAWMLLVAQAVVQ